MTSPYKDRKIIPISELILNVKKGEIKQIDINEDKLTIYKKNKEIVQSYKEFGSSVYGLFNSADVDLGKTQVVVKDQSLMNSWINILSAILPIILMIAFFYFLFRQARGAQESIFSFGQSRAKLFNKDLPKTSLLMLLE